LKQSVAVLIPMLTFCLLLSGCGGQKEINRLAIVIAAAIDLAEKTDNLDLTVQIANPAATTSVNGGAGGDEAFFTVTGSGPTLGEAERDLYMRLPRLVYWSNMQVIIISEKLARQKLDSILDYLDRPTVFRRDMNLVVTPGNAKDVLAIKHPTEKMSGAAIANTQKIAFKHSKTIYPSDIHDFLLDLCDEGEDPILARLEIVSPPKSKEEKNKTSEAGGQKMLLLSGSAVFKKRKMVGWLNGAETRGALWVWGEVQQGMMTFRYPGPQNKRKLITVLNQKESSTVTFKITNGKPQMTVSIKAEGRLSGENFVTREATTDAAVIAALDREYAKAIITEIKNVLAKTQKEYAADIFGFGLIIAHWNPKMWKKLKPHWEREFRNLSVDIQVEAHIRRIGLSMGPTNPR
jgi:spore germination protein KC